MYLPRFVGWPADPLSSFDSVVDLVDWAIRWNFSWHRIFRDPKSPHSMIFAECDNMFTAYIEGPEATNPPLLFSGNISFEYVPGTVVELVYGAYFEFLTSGWETDGIDEVPEGSIEVWSGKYFCYDSPEIRAWEIGDQMAIERDGELFVVRKSDLRPDYTRGIDWRRFNDET